LSNKGKDDFNGNAGRFISKIKQEKPGFLSEIEPNDIFEIIPIKTKKNNDRIKMQAGLFLLFGLNKDDTCLSVEQKGWIVKKFIIEKEHKKDIIKQLKSLNISRNTLFPGLEESAKEIVKRYDDIIKSHKNGNR